MSEKGDRALNEEFRENDTRVCPRCTVKHYARDFRGDVCGWCADDLEESGT